MTGQNPEQMRTQAVPNIDLTGPDGTDPVTTTDTNIIVDTPTGDNFTYTTNKQGLGINKPTTVTVPTVDGNSGGRDTNVIPSSPTIELTDDDDDNFDRMFGDKNRKNSDKSEYIDFVDVENTNTTKEVGIFGVNDSNKKHLHTFLVHGKDHIRNSAFLILHHYFSKGKYYINHVHITKQMLYTLLAGLFQHKNTNITTAIKLFFQKFHKKDMCNVLNLFLCYTNITEEAYLKCIIVAYRKMVPQNIRRRLYEYCIFNNFSTGLFNPIEPEIEYAIFKRLDMGTLLKPDITIPYNLEYTNTNNFIALFDKEFLDNIIAINTLNIASLVGIRNHYDKFHANLDNDTTTTTKRVTFSPYKLPSPPTKKFSLKKNLDTDFKEDPNTETHIFPDDLDLLKKKISNIPRSPPSPKVNSLPKISPSSKTQNKKLDFKSIFQNMDETTFNAVAKTLGGFIPQQQFKEGLDNDTLLNSVLDSDSSNKARQLMKLLHSRMVSETLDDTSSPKRNSLHPKWDNIKGAIWDRIKNDPLTKGFLTLRECIDRYLKFRKRVFNMKDFLSKQQKLNDLLNGGLNSVFDKTKWANNLCLLVKLEDYYERMLADDVLTAGIGHDPIKKQDIEKYLTSVYDAKRHDIYTGPSSSKRRRKSTSPFDIKTSPSINVINPSLDNSTTTPLTNPPLPPSIFESEEDKEFYKLFCLNKTNILSHGVNLDNNIYIQNGGINSKSQYLSFYKCDNNIYSKLNSLKLEDFNESYGLIVYLHVNIKKRINKNINLLKQYSYYYSSTVFIYKFNKCYNIHDYLTFLLKLLPHYDFHRDVNLYFEKDNKIKLNRIIVNMDRGVYKHCINNMTSTTLSSLDGLEHSELSVKPCFHTNELGHFLVYETFL